MLNVVSLFSGIGGVEAGLHRAGHKTSMFCEIDPAASAVLSKQFPNVPIKKDVTLLRSLPPCELVAAGFPCQDLSLAGGKAGMGGDQSSLVHHMFRLLDTRSRAKPEWLLFENVPYMLALNSSSAMRSLVKMVEAAGYRWAYRVVDARTFGIPQRRQRIVLLASRNNDPCSVLFADEFGTPDSHTRPMQVDESLYYGFYWTMGKMGAGWAREATPPIKGGSGLGIPSPPAVWIPARDFVGTPDIRDAERLQGFRGNWTRPIEDLDFRSSIRWRLIGNAVSPKLSEWVGRRLNKPGSYVGKQDKPVTGGRWPRAAWGAAGRTYAADVTEWPIDAPKTPLSEFLKFPLKPLSLKATKGFRSRALVSKEISWSPRFLDSLAIHIARAETSISN
jgi:DNA (cytosine-5)-methyltransferase 1